MLRLLGTRLSTTLPAVPTALLPRGGPCPSIATHAATRAMAASAATINGGATPAPAASMAAAVALANADAEQTRLMAERVLLVDEDDTITGSASKVDAHLLSGGLPLHRAFSVFLFDRRRRLCLQKRAATKLTFPGYWTNTCCSHPLAGGAETGGVGGAAVAAVRKLGHELGVPAGGGRGIAVDDLVYMTRVHYRAASGDARQTGGGEAVAKATAAGDPAAAASAGAVWGEHEIDYVFLACKEVDMVPEANEVEEVAWVGPDQLRSMLAGEGGVAITPWCRAIAERFIFGWWDKVDSPAALVADRDADTIHRFGDC